jgi:hypothetical protein
VAVAGADEAKPGAERPEEAPRKRSSGGQSAGWAARARGWLSHARGDATAQRGGSAARRRSADDDADERSTLRPTEDEAADAAGPASPVAKVPAQPSTSASGEGDGADGAEPPARPESGINGWILKAGDILLLDTDREFLDKYRYSNEFHVLSRHGRPPDVPAWHKWFCITVMLAIVALAAANVTTLFVASCCAAAVLICIGIIPWQEARQTLDTAILLNIAGSIGLGLSLVQTGAVREIAHALVGLAPDGSPLVSLMLIYIMAVLTTELASNAASAVLMVPLAVEAAVSLGVNTLPFTVVATIGASNGYINAYGYQVLLLVMSPGRYTLKDYLKFGGPLTIVSFCTTVFLAPVVYDF